MGQASALVTGGGTGIGRRVAERLVQDGYAVTIMGRREGPLKAVAAEFAESISIQVGDVTNEDDVALAIAQANGIAPLKVAVLAAGAGGDGSRIVSTSLKSWRDVLSVNLDGAFITLRAAARTISRNGGGSIIAISSVAATNPPRLLASYAVSKAALEALIANAANELGANGVRVNAIRAGAIQTEMTERLFRDEAFVARQVRQTPLARLGSTGDVAEAVSFLVGEGAAWITGACLAVDGGNHLRGAIELSGSD